MYSEAKCKKQHYGREHSTWRPPNRLPEGIRQLKNSWVHPPTIEDFYQQFMGSFLASSVETDFHRDHLREVHTVIDRNNVEHREILPWEAKPLRQIILKDRK
jgi:hypothetical protein